MNIPYPPLPQGSPARIPSVWVFTVAVILAVAGRLALSRLGHNFDFESWQLVVDLQEHGKNVYASTCRYNYGPLWMWLLYALKWLFATHFRTGVALFLSLVDAAIAALLFRRGNKFAAYIILFSPVCIIITGFHNQMENMAILLILLAVRYAEKRRHYSNLAQGFGLSTAETILFALLIGASLIAKHIFIFLPIWFVFHKQLSVKQKAILFCLPYTLFLATFIPYLSGIDGILSNVIFYKPGENSPLFHMLVGRDLAYMLCTFIASPYKMVFFGSLILTGLFLRRKPLMELVLLYSLFVVLYTSLLSNQYLVIPMVFLAVSKSRLVWAYNVVAGLFLFFNELELNMIRFASGFALKMVLFLQAWGFTMVVAILLFAAIDHFNPTLLHRSTLQRKMREWLA